jgi:hypothetical protein
VRQARKGDVDDPEQRLPPLRSGGARPVDPDLPQGLRDHLMLYTLLVVLLIVIIIVVLLRLI